LRASDAVAAVRRALEDSFGVPRKEGTGDPLSGLVHTILSQNTNDRNRDRAFRNLRSAFPTWEDVAEAGPEPVEKVIRVGGLARIKALRIVQLLRDLRVRGSGMTLDGLRDLPIQEAEGRLLSIAGVGKKTARCVLLFELGMPAFPADTHILRVTRRLGWVPERATPDRAHDILQGLVPPEAMHSLHLNLIRLGRTICRPRQPRCEVCPIRRSCRYGGGELEWGGRE
jgi:endonuclease-3